MKEEKKKKKKIQEKDEEEGPRTNITKKMAVKCVHKGCGKMFTDPEENSCVYHPGPPIFHEGHKGTHNHHHSYSIIDNPIIFIT